MGVGGGWVGYWGAGGWWVDRKKGGMLHGIRIHRDVIFLQAANPSNTNEDGLIVPDTL